MYVAGPNNPMNKFIITTFSEKCFAISSTATEFKADNSTKNIGPKNIIAI